MQPIEHSHRHLIVQDLPAIARLLHLDPSLVNARDEHGRTPLHYAALEGYITVAELLIDNNAEIDAVDNYGETPLFPGIYEEILVYDHCPMVKLLLSRGAKVNIKDENGATPLHMAAIFGEIEIVQELIKSGADINAQTDLGETPLHGSVQYPNWKTVETLLSYDEIDSGIKNHKGQTPYEVAIEKGWLKSAELLSNHVRSHK